MSRTLATLLAVLVGTQIVHAQEIQVDGEARAPVVDVQSPPSADQQKNEKKPFRLNLDDVKQSATDAAPYLVGAAILGFGMQGAKAEPANLNAVQSTMLGKTYLPVEGMDKVNARLDSLSRGVAMANAMPQLRLSHEHLNCGVGLGTFQGFNGGSVACGKLVQIGERDVAIHAHGSVSGGDRAAGVSFNLNVW